MVFRYLPLYTMISLSPRDKYPIRFFHQELHVNLLSRKFLDLWLIKFFKKIFDLTQQFSVLMKCQRRHTFINVFIDVTEVYFIFTNDDLLFKFKQIVRQMSCAKKNTFTV